MTVLAVLSILAAIATPSFQDVLTSSRLRTSANDVLAGLNLAKSEAIRRNAPIRLCLDLAQKTWRATTTTAPATDIRIGQLHTDVGIGYSDDFDDTSEAGQACIRFRGDGLPYGENGLVADGSIDLSLGSDSRDVSITPGGFHVD